VNLHTSDLLAFYGVDWLSRLIQWRTRSASAPRFGPNHVGVVGYIDDPHKLNGSGRYRSVLFESTTRNTQPCLLRRQKFSGLQAQSINLRVSDYVRSGGRVELYRLRHDITFSQVEFLNDYMRKRVSEAVPYDTFGAIGSSRWYWVIASLWRTDLESVFCSEFAAECDMKINRLPPDNPASYSPAHLVRTHLANASRYLRATCSELDPEGRPVWSEA